MSDNKSIKNEIELEEVRAIFEIPTTTKSIGITAKILSEQEEVINVYSEISTEQLLQLIVESRNSYILYVNPDLLEKSFIAIYIPKDSIRIELSYTHFDNTVSSNVFSAIDIAKAIEDSDYNYISLDDKFVAVKNYEN